MVATTYVDLVDAAAIKQGEDFTLAFFIFLDTLPAPPFVVSTRYVEGDYCVPQAGAETGYRYRAMNSGTAAGAAPAWPTVKGGRVTSNAVTYMAVGDEILLDTGPYGAEMKIRTDPDAPTAAATFTTGNGRLQTGYSPAPFLGDHVYAEGQLLVPRVPNGWVYECVNGGTSDTGEPSGGTPWPTALGAVVTNGGCVFRCVATDEGVSNLRIALTSGYTAALENWGDGRYDIELVDGFGKRTRYFQGNVRLSQEITR